MVACVLGSFSSFFWSLSFLLLVLTIASLSFVQALTTYQIETDLTFEQSSRIETLFGSVIGTMLNLPSAPQGVVIGSSHTTSWSLLDRCRQLCSSATSHNTNLVLSAVAMLDVVSLLA